MPIAPVSFWTYIAMSSKGCKLIDHRHVSKKLRNSQMTMFIFTVQHYIVDCKNTDSFAVYKYARTVTPKVWSEADNMCEARTLWRVRLPRCCNATQNQFWEKNRLVCCLVQYSHASLFGHFVSGQGTHRGTQRGYSSKPLNIALFNVF